MFQKENEFNKRFQERMIAVPYPTENISENWKQHAQKAMESASILGLGINPEDFEAIIRFLVDYPKGTGLSLYHFAVASNNLQKQSARDLGIGTGPYIELMQEADKYVQVWQERTNPIRDAIDSELEAEMAARGISPKGNQAGMKAVKE